MNIAVCLKQVPDTDARIKPTADGSGIETDGIKYITNPYDELALEAALQLKDANIASTVVVLTLGDAGSEKQIKDALARGADSAVRVDDPALAGSDALGIARALAAAANKAGASLILCGKQAIDGDSSQVPAMIAELLGCAQISVVDELRVEGSTVTAARIMGGGSVDVVTATLPAVVTCEKGLNEPRFASMKGIMMAKKKTIEVWGLGDLGLDASQVGAAGALVEESGFSAPPARPSGRILNAGSSEATVAELVKLLREEAKVI